MSTRKTKLTPRSVTPKSNTKTGLNTSRLNTLKSTPKTDSKISSSSSSKVVKNLNIRENNASCNATLNTTAVIDPTHSHKYMQHKLDMAYNKYLQTLALNSWLTKMHKEANDSIDEQLVHYEEMHDSAREEEQTKSNVLNEVKIFAESNDKVKCLESSLENVTQFIKEKNLIDKIKKLNNNLHYFCDKLMFENIKFVNTEDNYNRLQNTLEEISTTLNEINSGGNEDFLVLSEYIFNIIELLKSLRKNQKIVKNYQNDINNLTLRASSLELCKTQENTLKK